jgi:putative serine protease PepD
MTNGTAPVTGVPITGSPYSHQPLSGPPFQQPPPFGPGGAPYPYHPAAQPSSGRAGRVVLVLIAAMALSLASGAVGGLIVHSASDNNGGTTVINRQNAPQVDRSSVAGVAEAVLPSVVDITTGEGEGSGVIMSSDGAIITNNHVVEGANGSQVTVTFSNGKTAKASIVGTDPLGDIAVIKAQGVTGLTAAKFGDSDAARVGDTVLAIGSPLGLQGSVSEGIISALHRTISEGSDQQGGSAKSISDALQTDAAINPGNSGGALVNLAGEVVGINTAIATSGGQSSGNIGVGFAISSNRAKSAADQLLKGGKVSHPYLGVRLSDGNAGGAIIADVVAGGPAAKAGLQKGDIVTKIDSQAIGDATALINVVQGHKVGDKLNLTVNRNGSETQVTVTLGDTPQ